MEDAELEAVKIQKMGGGKSHSRTHTQRVSTLPTPTPGDRMWLRTASFRDVPYPGGGGGGFSCRNTHRQANTKLNMIIWTRNPGRNPLNLGSTSSLWAGNGPVPYIQPQYDLKDSSETLHIGNVMFSVLYIGEDCTCYNFLSV